MYTLHFTHRDLAEERGHTLCVQFLNDPAKAYLEDRRLHNNASSSLIRAHLVNSHSYLTPLQEVAEGLGMLMFTGMAVDPRATKGKKKKVFGFRSKPKV